MTLKIFPNNPPRRKSLSIRFLLRGGYNQLDMRKDDFDIDIIDTESNHNPDIDDYDNVNII